MKGCGWFVIVVRREKTKRRAIVEVEGFVDPSPSSSSSSTMEKRERERERETNSCFTCPVHFVRLSSGKQNGAGKTIQVSRSKGDFLSLFGSISLLISDSIISNSNKVYFTRGIWLNFSAFYFSRWYVWPFSSSHSCSSNSSSIWENSTYGCWPLSSIMPQKSRKIKKLSLTPNVH